MNNFTNISIFPKVCVPNQEWTRIPGFKAKPKYAYIYALVDPLDKTVRYIGMTVNPKKRLKGHKKKNKGRHIGNTRKSAWIVHLKASRMTPIMEIIEACALEEYASAESCWINAARSLGDIYNVSDGGDGFWRHVAHKELDKPFVCPVYRYIPPTANPQRTWRTGKRKRAA